LAAIFVPTYNWLPRLTGQQTTDMNSRARTVTAVATGLLAASLLLGVYFGILTLVSGWEFTLEQFGGFWHFIVALAIGFGVQVGLYPYLRSLARQCAGAGKVAAVSGGTSAAAMISCCTHYLANIVPVLGATGLVALVGQYQVELFWVGLAFNLAGVVYIGAKVAQASRHMALMAQAA
jgi:Cu+-exporting ATPase